MRVGELVGGEEAPAPELPLHRDRRALDPHLAELAALPLAPEKRVEIPLAEALDRLGHLALERETPHLPVGDDVHARVLLEPQNLVDGGVLGLLQLGRAELALLEPVARGEQLRRPEEAADDVRARLEHAATVLRATARRAIGPAATDTMSPFRSKSSIAPEMRADASSSRPSARSISASASRTSA